MSEIIRQTKEISEQDIRRRIQGFEDRLRQVPGVQYGDLPNCPLKHSFTDGMYVREIFIPKGMVIVGKIHRHAHPNFLLKGKVIVVTETGGVQKLSAPLSMISPAGTKRVVFTLEDTVWITVHATNETDLEKIEAEVIAKSYEDLGMDPIAIQSDEANVEKMIEVLKTEGK